MSVTVPCTDSRCREQAHTFEPWMLENLDHWIPDDWQIRRLAKEGKHKLLMPLIGYRRKLVEQRLATERTARAWIKADRAIGAR